MGRGRGGAAGWARGARAGGISIAVWCSAGGERAVQCVAAAAREVSEGESEAKRERAGLAGWTKSRARANSRRPDTKPTGVKLTPVGWEPGR